MAREIPNGGEADQIVWNPTEEQLKRSRLLRFIREHGIANYEAFLGRSMDDPNWYWDAVVKHLGIEWYRAVPASARRVSGRRVAALVQRRILQLRA